MSKITIFLCAVLFAAAVDATHLSNVLASAQQTVEALVAAEIAKVEQNYENARTKATELYEQLEKAANAFSDRVAEEVKKVEDKLQEDIKKLVAGTKDVDVTECDKENEHLRNLGSIVISNMTACIVDKKETANAYIENINMAATNVIGNLSAIRDESHRCGENVVGIVSALSAIGCTKLAGVKAGWVATKSVPALTVNMGKMNYLLSTIQPSLAYCTASHGLGSFYHESRKIIRNTKICIQQKVDEARRNPTTVKDDNVEAETVVPEEEKIDTETVVPDEKIDNVSVVPDEKSATDSVVPDEKIDTVSVVPDEKIETEAEATSA